MIDDRELFERAALRFDPPPGELTRLMRRRDSKRRNQQLGAGVVGIAIGAAIILAAISISRSDQSPATPSPTAVRHNGDVAVRTSRGMSVIDASTGRSRVV